MIYFFTQDQTVFAVSSPSEIDEQNIEKLKWLFGNAEKVKENSIVGHFIGPRKLSGSGAEDLLHHLF